MSTEATPPYVREELDARSLHFSAAAIQSRMHLRRPDVLALEYTRLMMGWLLFAPAATRLAMLGLGGGSIAKFCYRHLPGTAMTVIEIDPQVIALRDKFMLPADGPRLRVLEADGARFVAATDERFDVLLVDAFDAEGMPAALGTQRFYDDALDVLRPDGLLVVNLHAGHAHQPLYVERIRRSFGNGVFCVVDHDGTNSVVFAARGERLRRQRVPLRRPVVLAEAPWQELRAAFARVGSAAQRARERDAALQGEGSVP